MHIGIATDHAGFEFKQIIKNFLHQKNLKNIKDLGCLSEESVDYPDYAHALAEMISKKTINYGILCCGSGNGMAMTANRHLGVRAALCWNVQIAHLARAHNDANILVLPARFITSAVALELVETFLNTNFEAGRHQKRIEKIDQLH